MYAISCKAVLLQNRILSCIHFKLGIIGA